MILVLVHVTGLLVGACCAWWLIAPRVWMRGYRAGSDDARAILGYGLRKPEGDDRG